MSLNRFSSVIRTHRRLSWLVVFAIVTSVSVFITSVNGQPAIDVQAAGQPKTLSIQVSSTTSGGKTNPAAPDSGSASSVVPNCTPDTSYATPSPIDLSDKSTGLTEVDDPPSSYQIYGNTVAQIEAQAQRCAPKSDSSDATADFMAETGYNLTTQYEWVNNGAGQCQVSSAKVGLHLNMVLPQWQATASADSGLAGEWQTYVTDLQTHENGHVSIDRQYADQLLADLQNFPVTDCNTIASALSAKVSSDTAALDAANDAYDAATNHGATQGAVLP